MIQILVSYDDTGRLPADTDDSIRAILRLHSNGLECEGSGAGFGRRDLEFWADYLDPDIDLEMALEPLFLRNLEVVVDYEYEEDDDD